MGNRLSRDWLSQRKRNRAGEESTDGASTSSSKRAKEESTEGASTSSSISPTAEGVGSGQYNVFLSFRGSDTRKEFTDHLYHSLVKAGTIPICVFKDDKCIPIGEKIDLQIFDAIARSKISIPIISENYASSKWCLLELIHIMERKKSSSHIVLPIFYKVAPSDVRHLTGKFGDAFRLYSSQQRFHEKDIQEGQQALREVTSLNGWESSKVANGCEGELVQLVVKKVLSKLQKDFQLDIPRQLVGLDGCLMKIMNWIRIPSVNARMIGIYGMGGIGKTTLAKCIYNKLLDEFEHASSLLDIREKATQRHGIEDLQNQLIHDILHIEYRVSRVDDGINIIKYTFREKRALILLDDIDDKTKLDVLARERNWFMAGSVIIVTTRNEAVLDQSEFEVDYKYELNELDEVHSLLLFNRHAFRMDHSLRDFESISRNIVSTMGGLPLALEVVGAYLYKKTNKKVWEDVWKQLKRQPHRDVEKILRISYDTLEDRHKQIFLDIACFFIGERSEFAMCMWEDCGYFPRQGIEELKLRCLIKIGDCDKFEMHDQLRDLGRSIFCQGQPLERRSGPWDDDYEGIPRVLRHKKIRHLMRPASSGESNDLFSEVRWLEWCVQGSDLSLSTTNLHLPNLSVLELSDSEITEDWEGWSSFMASKRLRVLNLWECRYLRCLPDLSTFTRLKILVLRYCFKLEHLHPSIGKLKSLVSLDLFKCESLQELPAELGELKDLEQLTLDFAGITKLPTSIGSLRKLKKLNARWCESLREIPSSIGDLQNLQIMDFGYSAIEKLPNAIGRLKNLQTLDIALAPVSDLPRSIQNLSSLQRLCLWRCDKLQSLPELPLGLRCVAVSCRSLRLTQLSSLTLLQELRLKECHLLEYIPELSSRLLKLCVQKCDKLMLLKLDGFKYLEELSMKKCSSVERLDLSRLTRLKRLHVEDLNNLVEIKGHDNLEFLEGIFIYDCNSIKRLLYPKSRCLKQLMAIECHDLVQIEGCLDSAKLLEILVFAGCKSMETLPDLTGCEMLRSLVVKDCRKLTQLQGLEKLDLLKLDISGCDSLEVIPKLPGTRVFRNYERNLYRSL